MEKQKTEIRVGGQTYTLLTDEAPETVERLAAAVNEKLNVLLAGGRVSLQQALILTALELAQDAENQRAAAQNLKAQIGDYLEDAERAMTERDHYKRENEKLREKLKH